MGNVAVEIRRQYANAGAIIRTEAPFPRKYFG